ncbi:MAG TPA: DoxX family protein [Thermoanaerobaculia bacterium]|nr:DoxX family protein [Thermoanaerobaculia bacterium]
MSRAREVALFLLRVVAGLLFLQHGGQKLFAWFGGMPPDGASASAFTLAWFGGVLEFFGGFLVIVGLCTRPVAFVLAGEMAYAYFRFHQPGGFWPAQNHGEMAVLYCFIFLLIAAHGAGPWSLDARRRSRREPPTSS